MKIGKGEGKGKEKGECAPNHVARILKALRVNSMNTRMRLTRSVSSIIPVRSPESKNIGKGEPPEHPNETN